MKKCPNCQATFDDDKRFCQVDGTPLIEAIEAPPVDENPFKTVVMGQNPLSDPTSDPMKTTVIRGDAKDEDILQIPDVFDPMKTMVVSSPIKYDVPKENPPVEEPIVPAPEPPKFNEPNLTPPSFGDISANQPPVVESPKIEPPKIEPPKFEVPKIEPPISNPFSDAPKFDKPISNPFSDAPKFDSPFSSPANEPPKFDSNPLPSESSPFEAPKNEPVQTPFSINPPIPPPFKDSEPAFTAPPSPFGQNNPVNQQIEQSEWTPPSAPGQDWQNPSLGTDNSSQAVGNAAGQNKTLAFVSLALGVLSFLCGLSFIGAIPAVITGYMQKGKIKSNPAEYGGGGLATVGMILGVANIILSIIGIILYALLVLSIVRF